MAEAENQLRLCQKHDIQVLFYTEKNYPDRLKPIADAPALLFYKGTARLNAGKIVSVVGTRSASPYGKAVTEELIESLQKYPDMLIVSGLAYGIDITAHKAALKNNLPTVGVMATGLDTVYPAPHKAIATQMLEEGGGLLTEYKWGNKTDPSFFPARNRIIAGLADAVIVVEAAKTGGALITAEIANSYNKDVFAVPGNLKSKFSEGCNHLIKIHKASLFTSVKDLEYLMNWDLPGEFAKPAPKQLSIPENFSENEQKVLKILQQHKEMQLDELSWQSQVSLNQLASVLLNLELSGYVKALPGKKFSLA